MSLLILNVVVTTYYNLCLYTCVFQWDSTFFDRCEMIYHILSFICHFIMNRVLSEQRLRIVQIYYQNEMTNDPGFNKKILFTIGWMPALINKIVAFGLVIIHKTLLRHRYILEKSLFGMLYGQRELLVHISHKWSWP